MKLKLVLLVTLASVGAVQAGVAGDSNLEMLDTAISVENNEARSADDVMRLSALYTKEADRCTRAYFVGDTKSAEASWIKLLPMLKNMSSIGGVIKSLHGHVVMCSNDDVEPKCWALCLYASIARATERALGPNHRFCADAIALMGDDYESEKDFKRAIDIRQKELSIRLKCNGAKSEQTGDCAFSLALDCHIAKDYKKALQYNDQAIAAFKAIKGSQKKLNKAERFRQVLLEKSSKSQ